MKTMKEAKYGQVQMRGDEMREDDLRNTVGSRRAQENHKSRLWLSARPFPSSLSCLRQVMGGVSLFIAMRSCKSTRDAEERTFSVLTSILKKIKK